MKKIILVVLLVAALAVVLAGCSGSATPKSAWADEEVLNYDIKKNTVARENIGTMKVTTVRNPVDKTLDGKEYASADSKVTIDIVLNDETDPENKRNYVVHTELLAVRYTVLATHKEYVDLNDESKCYVLKAHHSGKNYIYTLNDGAEKKLKVGSSGYSDSEYIYHYIRCYPLTSPPSSIKIPDPINNTVNTVSCVAYKSTKIVVNYPGGPKEADCAVIRVSLSSAPEGKPIYVAFTPESDDYYMSELSMMESMKMPVEIEENDLVYTISSMKAK